MLFLIQLINAFLEHVLQLSLFLFVTINILTRVEISFDAEIFIIDYVITNLIELALRKSSPTAHSILHSILHPHHLLYTSAITLSAMDWSSSSESEDHCDEEIVVVLSTIGALGGMGSSCSNVGTRKWRGSVPGRRPNKKRILETVMSTFNEMYFGSDSIYSEADFEPRFRMP